LIPGKVIKIVATRCHILRLKWLKCTKIDFGWGSTPDPLDGKRGHTSKERGRVQGREEEEKGRGAERMGRNRRQREKRGIEGTSPVSLNFP